jgi:2-haloacid dehalogenase
MLIPPADPESLSRRRLARLGGGALASLVAAGAASAAEPSLSSGIDAIVFDALGTLFDTGAIEAEATRLFSGKGALLTQVWRLKQLEYTWLASAADSYTPLATLSRQSLDYAAQAAGVDLTADKAARLLAVYALLPAFADVAPALRRMRAKRMAILSASGGALLQSLTAKAGLQDLIPLLITTEPAQVYKPSPRAYALATAALKLPPGHVLFVSSNGFDVWGAARFGFRTAWLQRPAPQRASAGPVAIAIDDVYPLLRGRVEGLEPKPDRTVASLTELADLAGMGA